jgi:hypothetical protein
MRRNRTVTGRVALSIGAAIVLICTQSACGKSQQQTAHSPHRTASTIGSEPPQTQPQELPASYDHQVVATDGDRTITLAYLEKWTSLEVFLASKYKVSSSVPTGYVPDPPLYRRCIAYLAATTGARKVIGRSTQEQLKNQCEEEHEKQAESTLTHMLVYLWIPQEAARRGIRVSQEEVEHGVSASGVKPAVVEALGVPPSYEGLAIRAELSTTKLYQSVPAYLRMDKEGHESVQLSEEIDNQDSALYTAMKRRGISHTHCQPGFVVFGCSNYQVEGEGP